MLTTLLLFPLLPRAGRAQLRRRWSRRLLAALGLRLEITGTLPPGSAMIVANHVSWVDIFAINALAPAAFISKADVRAWPLIGWLAARNETVFLRRGSRGHARVINAEVASLIAEGRRVALFPEGTTTDGGRLLPFHGALLQPAIAARAVLIPLAIRYRDAAGGRSDAAVYVGETTLWQSMRSIVRGRGLTLQLIICAPIASGDGDRKALARAAWARIAAALFDAPEAASPAVLELAA